MAKTKKKSQSRPTVPKIPTKTEGPPKLETSPQPIRETIESFAIAIVLAFLIRTFAAEAFVIPTGSMANTLMGQHQDVYCAQCGQRYQVSASDEQDDSILKSRPHDPSPVSPQERNAHATVAGTCPTCRDTMIYSSREVPEFVSADRFDVENLGRPFGGDRIIVNKFIYDFQDPERWDVIVFRYPGNASENYIKRLVGLPNERLRVYQGEVFIRPSGADAATPYEIQRKPADKLLAIRELVHDTEHDAARLYEAGWPLRWQAVGEGWKTTSAIEGNRVLQQHFVEQPTPNISWIQYRHTPADLRVWERVHEDRPAERKVFDGSAAKPELVGDFNAYNSSVLRYKLNERGIESLQQKAAENGMHWVGDLILEADVNVTGGDGEILLDLVKGGRHFVCTIDTASGRAKFGIEEFESRAPIGGYSPQAETSVTGSGRYRLRFAHVDEQLLLWIDGRLVSFDGSTTYDYEKLFGDRKDNIPRTSDSDWGDLAPAAIGARKLSLTVDRINLSRDIYYIAVDVAMQRQKGLLTDLPHPDPHLRNTPSRWDAYRERDEAIFPLGKDQLFVMGDNSPASQDARLWAPYGPGGSYLDAKLLIGKAVFVYWPHSWYSIPKTPIPLWPNFRDMRLVR